MNTMSTTSRDKINCLSCGDEFSPNHGNRKYCNDKCKERYSNAQAKKRRLKRAAIDRVLKTNYEILDRIIGNQKEVTKSVEFMHGTGFDFNRYTHFVEYDGKPNRGIYEFTLILFDNNQTVKIIKNV